MRGAKIGVYLSDISGAFDKVSRVLLLGRLAAIGVPDAFLDFLASYLLPKEIFYLVIDEKYLLVSALCRDIAPCLHGASDCCEQLLALDSGPCWLKITFGKFILGQGAQTWNFPGAHLDGFQFPSGFWGLGLVEPQDFLKGDFCLVIDKKY